MPRSTSESTTSTCPADLEIFSPPRSRNSLCIHVPTHGCTSSTHSLCATSLVWWMRTWSMPPVWMSKRSPRYLVAIAEHSMCQPGNPRPQGESHSCCRSTPGRRQLPEREVGGVALGLDVLDAARGLELVEVEVGELGVAGERGHVEVDAVVDEVGVTLLLERADHRDLLGDVTRRRAARCPARGSRAAGGPIPTARCRARRSPRRSCPSRRRPAPSCRRCRRGRRRGARRR